MQKGVWPWGRADAERGVAMGGADAERGVAMGRGGCREGWPLSYARAMCVICQFIPSRDSGCS